MSYFTAWSHRRGLAVAATRNEMDANSTVKILDGTGHFPSRVMVAPRYINTHDWDAAHDSSTWDALFLCSLFEVTASSSKGEVQNRDPQLTPLPREIYGSKRVSTCTRQRLRRSLQHASRGWHQSQGNTCVQILRPDLCTRQWYEAIYFMDIYGGFLRSMRLCLHLDD